MTNSKELGVVSCFYNPCEYEQKYSNLFYFLNKILSVCPNILIVELLYQDQKSCLPNYVNSIQLHSEDILWHKENLLNLGIKKLLSEGYKNIAWLDADIVFDNICWQEETVACLQKHKLCQLFSSVVKTHNHLESSMNYGCVQHWLDNGSIFPLEKSYHTGLAWAARSEVLSNSLLYENSIIGGADSLLWLASSSKIHNFHRLMLNHPISMLNINGYLIDFFNWAEKWNSIVSGNVGNIKGTIHSMPHGTVDDRKYISRYQILEKHNYIPKEDLFYKNNIIHCNNEKLKLDIKKYFEERNEDQLNFLVKMYRKILNKQKLKKIKKLEKNLV